jgi:hypothetical protein
VRLRTGFGLVLSKSKSTASRWPADRDSGHARGSEGHAGRRTNRHGSNRSRVASRQHIQASQISDSDTDCDADQGLRKHGLGTKHVRAEQDVSKRGGCGRNRMVYDRDASYSPKRVSQGYRPVDVDRHAEVNRRRSRSEDGLRISARRHYTVNVDDEPYVESPEYDREARRPPGCLPNREAEYHPYDRPPYAVDVKEFDDCHHSRVAPPAARREKRIDNSVEMPRYDGTGDLDLFLQRFRTLAEYYQWTDDEQLFRLKTCIQGDAQYVLLDLIHERDVHRFTRQLRGRFQSSAHAERYRSELSRLRRGSMTLEQLHLKVRSLVSKAAPGPWTALTEIVARDAFLVALDDARLSERIMMTCPPPETLAAVYDLALRAVIVGRDRSKERHETGSTCQQERRPRYARGVAQPRGQSADAGDVSGSAKVHQLHEDNRRLQQQIAELQVMVTSLVTTTTKPPAAADTTASSVSVAVPSAAGQSSLRAGPRGGCFQCGQAGHYARTCPNRRQPTTRSTAPQHSGPKTNVIRGQCTKPAVYVTLNYNGTDYRALLDSGCDVSVLGRRILPGLAYQENPHELVAANSTPIPVQGTADVAFRMGGVDLQYTFWVSDAIDEIILGSDWMTDHRCIWDFRQALLRIGSVEPNVCVRLGSTSNREAVRRIYAAEDMEVPARSQCDIPVKSVWNTLPAKYADWLLESKTLPNGVMLARTLLAPGGNTVCVRGINSSNEVKTVSAGQLLGRAEPIQGHVPLADEHPEEENIEHIQCLIDDLPMSLTVDQRDRAAEFIRKQACVFSTSPTHLGRNNWLPHRIDTGNHPPVRQPLRRHPYAHLAEIESNVQAMLEAGVIRPSTSPWSSNVLLVTKKDGTSRFCVDMRKVNDLTVKQAYPLPRIDTCLESLGGSILFSTLDLRSSYWQAEIHPDDAQKTAFVTRSGQYEFTVLSMGLVNAPSQFQRLMDLVLAGLLWEVCLVYLDDVIIYSRTFDLHLERLEAVFARMKAANLLLKPSKCQLFREEVTFLGHVVSAKGIAADPSKIETVRQWPRPQNLTELRSFIGLCSYYRKYVPGFATIAQPLHMLTNKGQRFIWGEEQETAFQTLKTRLTTAPILAPPNDEGEYVLDTDGSSTGLGAVLQQRKGEELHVIAYASRCLSRAERNYNTTRRELLAVVFGLKQFRPFLLGRHFLLRVDHSSLTYLRRTPEVMGQAARWLEFIEEFNFTIQHRSGVSHGNCDALSRRPCSMEEKGESDHPCCRRTRQAEHREADREAEDREQTVRPTVRPKDREADREAEHREARP